MSETVNPPALHPWLLAAGAVSLAGVGLCAVKMTELRVGTEGWKASILAIAICIVGWVVVSAIFWFEERQLVFESDALIIRRWTDLLTRRPGRRVPLIGALRARIFTSGLGYSAVRMKAGEANLRVTTYLWPAGVAHRLPEILGRHGFVVYIGGALIDDQG
jgi:hypothetical protein